MCLYEVSQWLRPSVNPSTINMLTLLSMSMEDINLVLDHLHNIKDEWTTPKNYSTQHNHPRTLNVSIRTRSGSVDHPVPEYETI